ncbi:hypothetical protein TP2_17780 [Thioclava pacifica DSM 10166]|uniref:Uncharacterized protein n=1 Tax=Thioclava pacifica DSM 10166 TaxID=1353537 RepID=A0A074J7F4_9RHOB|nr:hypothetical protein TP2_17780 [Thioclava pacifica DSM 10166]
MLLTSAHMSMSFANVQSGHVSRWNSFSGVML